MEQRLNEVPSIDGLQSLPRSAFRVHRLTLVQPSSMVEGGSPGEWMLGNSGQSQPAIEVLLSHIQPIRTRWQGEGELGQPLCWSFNRLRPSAEVIEPYSQYCRNCPESLWKGDEPGPCSAGYLAFGALLPDFTPFSWRTGGEASGILERWAVGLSAIRPAIAKLWDIKVTLTAEKGRSAKGKYYIPVIRHTVLPLALLPEATLQGLQVSTRYLTEQA